MLKFPQIILSFLIMLTLIAGVVFSHPHQSFAAEEAKTADITKYNPGTYKCDMPAGQLIQPLIDCITKPVRAAILKPATPGAVPAIGPPAPGSIGLLAFVSQYMAKLVAITMILAVVIFGLKVFNVRNNPFTVGLSTLIKIGIALFLINNFGGFGEKLYDGFDEIVNFSNIGGTTIWAQIDAFLSDLLGFTVGNTGDINQGILALLNGSIFAKSLGIMVTVIGLFAIGSLLLFILQATYLYLSSYIGFGFMLAISPIFAIFLMFGYTERYFSKWLELILSTVLTPLLMLSFISMFLDIQPTGSGPPTPGLLRLAVDDVFIALGRGDKTEGKNYIKRCILTDQALFSSYMLPTDSTLVDQLACKNSPNPLNCSELDKNNSAPTWLNSSLIGNFDYMPFTVTKVDCGVDSLTGIDDDQIKKNVFNALAVLFLYGMLINAMLHRIPDIAQDIANGVNVGISSLETPVQSLVSMIRR